MINELRPCGRCDHFEKLYDGRKVCENGYCRYTNSTQPISEYWFCHHFIEDGRRMDGKLAFANIRRRKRDTHRRRTE